MGGRPRLPSTRMTHSRTPCCIAQAIGHLTNDGNMRWLEINTRLPTSKDLPSSLVQLRNAVWTGDTRDTRPNSDIAAVPKFRDKLICLNSLGFEIRRRW